MNSETHGTLEEEAINAGAIVKCEICHGHNISASDADANSIAYARVTNLWKDGQFRGDSREEIMEMMKGVLENANHRCPSCG